MPHPGGTLVTVRTVAIVQARYGSTRLPGKVLEDVAGRPLLARILERVQASAVTDAVMVATTTDDMDRAVAALARSCGAEVFTGSVDDVLDRYHGAAAAAGADVVIRITADDPFKDPEVIDLVAGRLLGDASVDYASNTLVPTFPEGLDVECFTVETLERSWREARLPSEREHVTPYIWNHPGEFSLSNVSLDRDLSHLRWTIDYPDDLQFARAVYERLGEVPLFRMQDVLDLLDREPDLGRINAGHERLAGYRQSIAKEQEDDEWSG